MLSIQNLTNKSIRFQDVIIEPYGTITVTDVYDYITLARLTNSGKARYFITKAVQKQEEKPVEKAKAEEVKEQDTKVEELPVKEEPKVENTEVEEPVKEETREVKPKNTKTNNRKNKKNAEE